MTTETKQFSTSLAKINDAYMPLINQQLTGNGIDMDDYAKRCVINAISSINQTLETAGVSWNDKQLDQSNITQTLLSVASLKLNASASPNEVYFQVRNVKIKKNGKDEWKKTIEMGIEGDGNDAILARFGRDVKQVRQHWLVRENDHFEYPMFNGLKMEPPKWQPKGSGKVIRVVYPIIKNGNQGKDIIEYYIAEREEVVRNLIAHVKNNMMNETFGIAPNRFKASAEEKKKIDAEKDKILNKIEELGLDASLKDEEIKQYISPAWKDPQSRESMIIRKMRNNIVKKIPKDFESTLTELKYQDNLSDYEQQTQSEINEHANSEIIDFDEPTDTEDGEFKEIDNHVGYSESDDYVENESELEAEEQPKQNKKGNAPF